MGVQDTDVYSSYLDTLNVKKNPSAFLAYFSSKMFYFLGLCAVMQQCGPSERQEIKMKRVLSLSLCCDGPIGMPWFCVLYSQGFPLLPALFPHARVEKKSHSK